MAGGSMTISVDTYEQLVPLTQRVLCWAGTDLRRVRIDTQGPVPRVVIPEEIMSGKGALNLRRGGADVLSGYVAGTNAVYAATNALGAVSKPINGGWTCYVDTNQPTISNVVLSGYQATVTYANVTSNGTVNINWGDGSSTNGAAESGSSAHTYGNAGTYRITITDATSATDTGFFVVYIAR